MQDFFLVHNRVTGDTLITDEEGMFRFRSVQSADFYKLPPMQKVSRVEINVITEEEEKEGAE